MAQPQVTVAVDDSKTKSPTYEEIIGAPIPGKLQKNLDSRLKRRIRQYERRYEITSAAMAAELRLGRQRETDEIVKWMQAYTLLLMIDQETATAGTRLKTTGRSTSKAPVGSL